MKKIGIAIVTYKRLEYLQRVIEKIRFFTKLPYELVVAEDGGEDGTLEWCKSQSIPVITGKNHGVCWNKNRGLYYLHKKDCDPILILEDDCFPIEFGWEQDWIQGTARWGHLAYAHPKLNKWLISGNGTPDDPYVNNKCTAQCTSVSAQVLNEVGFLDVRFKGYGVGHAEWTTRIKKAKYGYIPVVLENGKKAKANLFITGGLIHNDAPTFKDRAKVAENEKLFELIKNDPIYRNPWYSDDERDEFISEFNDALKNNSKNQKLVCDSFNNDVKKKIVSADAPADAEANLIEYWNNLIEQKKYKKALEKILLNPRSYIVKYAWIETVAEHKTTIQGKLKPIPWFNYGFINFLEPRLRPEMLVFEYGCGYSTLWWQDRVSKVYSIDHDSDWVDEIKKRAKPSVSLKHVTLDYGGNYCQAVSNINYLFDIIVIDGRDRVNCAKNAICRLKDTGVLVFDNSQREKYRNGIDSIKALGFKEIQFSGIAPMTYVESFTSIIYKKDNCLDI